MKIIKTIWTIIKTIPTILINVCSNFIFEKNKDKINEIYEYLNNKLCGKLHRKRHSLPLLVILVSIVILVSLFAIYRCFFSDESTSEVYLSILQPYTEAGCYTSPDDIPLSDRTEIETEKAFSILSFVRNNDKQNSIIENQYCRILELEPIEEPVLILYAVIVADTLRIFAFNDGWGTAEALSIESLSFETVDLQGSLDFIIDEAHIAESLNVAPASGDLLAEYTLSREKFL